MSRVDGLGGKERSIEERVNLITVAVGIIRGKKEKGVKGHAFNSAPAMISLMWLSSSVNSFSTRSSRS